MKNFFEKHRHLIVIALILAVILAALTPLVVPLGLGLDKIINIPPRLRPSQYREVSVWCSQHGEQSFNYSDTNCSSFYTGDAAEELCRTLDRVRGKQCDYIYDERLCTFSLSGKQGARIDFSMFWLSFSDGQYKLATGPKPSYAWLVAEEDARELLRYCWCAEEPVQDHLRRVLTSPEQLCSVSLSTYQNGELQSETSLTREQIEALCAELDTLLQAVSSTGTTETNNPVPTHGTVSRWEFTGTNGKVWHLEYTHEYPRFRVCDLSMSYTRANLRLYWGQLFNVGEDVDLTALNGILNQ